MIKRLLIPLFLIVIVAAFYYFYYSTAEDIEIVQSPKATSVEALTIEPQKVRLWSEFSGRLQAVDVVEIRPEVSGKITEVHFEDGDPVEAGKILFVIDPRPFEAAVKKAEANLATAKSNAAFAEIEMERAENMIKTNAIAQRIYDERKNTYQVALASIKSSEAELKKAKLDLEYAYVRSPISGRAGRVEITLGNLVQTGPNAPLLTRIISIDPIYADFEVDEQTYLQSIRTIANDRQLEQDIPVELSIQGELYKGTIYTFDNRLDVASGTIRARAKFDNPDGTLVPGMFVSVKLAKGNEQEVLLIPEKAIGNDQNKKFVYVINEENKPEYREVRLGGEWKSQRIVLEGLKPGDRIIVKGIQHIKPGETVEIKETITHEG